eukprot:Nk52_evm3s16 gene=Nk52_evmTU3s16
MNEEFSVGAEPSRASQRMVDFFVVVGASDRSPPTPLLSHAEAASAVMWDENKNNRSNLNYYPITEVCLAKDTDKILEEFYCVKRTCSGNKRAVFGVDENYYLYVKRGYDSSPLVDLSCCVCGKQDLAHVQIPSSYCTLNSPVPLDEEKNGSVFALFGCRSGGGIARPPIVDVIVLDSPRDTPPEGYVELGTMTQSLSLTERNEEGDTQKLPAPVNAPLLCVKYATEYPLLDVRYKPTLLERYPSYDIEGHVLPDLVCHFCMPDGLIFRRRKFKSAFFSFVLTDGEGTKLYGFCLRTCEPIILNSNAYGSISNNPHTYREAFVPKSLCILSRYGFFSAFGKFLRGFYSLIVEVSPLPIERYISNMFEIPLPPPGSVSVHVNIGSESVCFVRPPKSGLPLMDFSLLPLFCALDIDVIIDIMALLLSEAKVIFFSRHHALLAPIAEAVCSLLFPFKWQHIFIPVCPILVLDFLQAPLPYVCGIGNYKADLSACSSDAIVVNIDSSFIYSASSPQMAPPPKGKHHTGVEIPFIPKRFELSAKLFDAASHLRVANYCRLEDVSEHPYRVVTDVNPDNKSAENVRTDLLRSVFLDYFADLMKHYRVCLKSASVNMTQLDVQPESLDIKTLFEAEKFLEFQEEKNLEFFDRFLDTQMFARFIEQRMDFVNSRYEDYVFFDDCCEYALMQSKGSVSCKRLQKDSTFKVYRSFEVPPPLPLNESGRKLMFEYKGVFPKLNTDLFYEPGENSVNLLYTPRSKNPKQTARSLSNPSTPDGNVQQVNSQMGPDGVHEANVAKVTTEPQRHTASHTRSRSLIPSFNATNKLIPGTKKMTKRTLQFDSSMEGSGAATEDCNEVSLTFCRTVFEIWFFLFSSFIVVCRRPELCIKYSYLIIEKMKACGVSPNESCFSHLLRACMKRRLGVEAKRIFKLLGEEGISPNAVTTGYFMAAISDTNVGSSHITPTSEVTADNWFTKGLDMSDVTIESKNACPSCKARVADEFILTGWTKSDSLTETSCPECKLNFLPYLTWHPRTDEVQSLTAIFQTTKCPYLSPVLLLREIEVLLKDCGSAFMQTQEALLMEQPTIFWNITWYFTSFKIPWNFDALKQLNSVQKPLANMGMFAHSSSANSMVASDPFLNAKGSVKSKGNAEEIRLAFENSRSKNKVKIASHTSVYNSRKGSLLVNMKVLGIRQKMCNLPKRDMYLSYKVPSLPPCIPSDTALDPTIDYLRRICALLDVKRVSCAIALFLEGRKRFEDRRIIVVRSAASDEGPHSHGSRALARWFHSNMYISLLALTTVDSYAREFAFAEEYTLALEYAGVMTDDAYDATLDKVPEPITIAFRSNFGYLRPSWRPNFCSHVLSNAVY